MLSNKPVFSILLTGTKPLPNTIALGGVDIGIIKAKPETNYEKRNVIFILPVLL